MSLKKKKSSAANVSHECVHVHGALPQPAGPMMMMVMVHNPNTRVDIKTTFGPWET